MSTDHGVPTSSTSTFSAEQVHDQATLVAAIATSIASTEHETARRYGLDPDWPRTQINVHAESGDLRIKVSLWSQPSPLLALHAPSDLTLTHEPPDSHECIRRCYTDTDSVDGTVTRWHWVAACGECTDPELDHDHGKVWPCPTLLAAGIDRA